MMPMTRNVIDAKKNGKLGRKEDQKLNFRYVLQCKRSVYEYADAGTGSFYAHIVY